MIDRIHYISSRAAREWGRKNDVQMCILLAVEYWGVQGTGKGILKVTPEEDQRLPETSSAGRSQVSMYTRVKLKEWRGCQEEEM